MRDTEDRFLMVRDGLLTQRQRLKRIMPISDYLALVNIKYRKRMSIKEYATVMR